MKPHALTTLAAAVAAATTLSAAGSTTQGVVLHPKTSSAQSEILGIRTPHPPNILILLADDLGYADVTFNGAKDIKTPNLQRLADTGVRLTNFRACPMCSPTRAGLMTGRWPLRYGLMKAVIPPWSKFGLPTTEKILPALLAPAGYDQRHMVGKWHLGHARLAFLPANRGFTSFYGLYNGAFEYFTHVRKEGGGQVDWHRDIPGKPSTVKEPGYSTDLLAADAVRFIQQDHAGKPYLLYVAFNAPHGPLQAKLEDLAKYENVNFSDPVSKTGKAGKKNRDNQTERRKYAAIIDNMDQNIGKILDAIDKSPGAANTLVLFSSDNGGLLPYSRNTPYRDGKFSVYEGGIRVCAAIRWPAAGLAGGKTNNALIGYIDIVPTLMTLAGLPLPPAGSPNALDGIDIMPVLRGETPAPVRPWYSYFDQSHNPGASVIEGDWKLVAHEGDVLAPGKTANTTYELYNIATDPSEKTNVLKAHPDIVKRLKARLTEFGKTAASEEESVGTRGDGQAGFKAPKDWIPTTP